MRGTAFEFSARQKNLLPTLRKQGVFSVADACDKLGIPRQTIYEPRNKYALDMIREAVLYSEDRLKSDSLRVLNANLSNEDAHIQVVSAKTLLDRADRREARQEEKEASVDGEFRELPKEALAYMAYEMPLEKLAQFRETFFKLYRDRKVNGVREGVKGLYDLFDELGGGEKLMDFTRIEGFMKNPQNWSDFVREVSQCFDSQYMAKLQNKA